MHNHFVRQVCGAALLTLLTFIFASGQEFRGSITGKVTDPNGAVVAGATVTVINTGTNAEATTVTNGEGTYDFPVLLPGKYKLLVTKEGFKVEAREQIEIRVADKLTIDVQLQTGSVSETVTVVATAVLETGSVSTGSVIERKQIAELPLSEGTAYQLATLIRIDGPPGLVAPVLKRQRDEIADGLAHDDQDPGSRTSFTLLALSFGCRHSSGVRANCDES